MDPFSGHADPGPSVFRGLIQSVLYSPKTWTLMKSNIKRLEAFQNVRLMDKNAGDKLNGKKCPMKKLEED